MNYIHMIVSAAVGGIAGTIGTLILLPFTWHMEQKKLRYHARKELISEIREFLASDQYEDWTFSNTVEYSKIKPHLSRSVIENVQGINITIINGRGWRDY